MLQQISTVVNTPRDKCYNTENVCCHLIFILKYDKVDTLISKGQKICTEKA